MFKNFILSLFPTIQLKDLSDLSIYSSQFINLLERNNRVLDNIYNDLSSFFFFEKKRKKAYDSSLIKFSPKSYSSFYLDSYSLKDYMEKIDTEETETRNLILNLILQISNDKSVSFPSTLNAIPNVSINKEEGNDLVFTGTSLVSTSGYNPDYSFLGLYNVPDNYRGQAERLLYWNPQTKEIEFIEKTSLDSLSYNKTVSLYKDLLEHLYSPNYSNPVFFDIDLDEFTFGEFTEFHLSPALTNKELHIIFPPIEATMSFIFDNCYLQSTVSETDIDLTLGLSMKLVYSTESTSYFILNKQNYYLEA